jgi:hypothetical protein
MKTYRVSVQATITKTIELQAKDKATAIEVAFATFTPERDGTEDYFQEVIDSETAGADL